MKYFDYENVAKEAKMPPDKLEALKHLIREEFPRDDMLYELHLLRVCMAILDGHTTIDKALRSEEAA